MKKNTLIFIMLLGLVGLLVIQSCHKDYSPVPKTYLAAMPSNPSPAVDGVVAFTGTGQTINLTWDATATNAPKWDVYFGTSETPPLVASGVTGNTYPVTITVGGTYYWQVITHQAITSDDHGVESTGTVWSFDVNSNPGIPNTPKPDSGSTGASCSPTITWKCVDPESDELTYDLYLGTTATPALAATGLTSASYAPATLSAFTTYFWKVVAHDPFGGSSTSNLWKFTTGALPAATYTGNYLVDEPAESYTYNVSFTLVDATHVKTTNYWNSGWSATFTLDLTNLTYTLPFKTFQTNWTGTESGIIDPATGNMQGTYTIWYKGQINEQGVHTYTKQ